MHGQLGETKRHIICWPVSTARKTMGLPYLRHLEIDSFVDSQNFPTSLSLPKRKKISSTVEYRGPSVIISGVRASFVSYICATETWKGIKANVFQSFHWHEPASAGNKLRPAATAGEEKKNSLKIEKKEPNGPTPPKDFVVVSYVLKSWCVVSCVRIWKREEVGEEEKSL